MNIFSRNVKEIGTISIILIILSSFGLLFYIQNITKINITTNLFDQQKQRQMESTKSISQHIGSDLNLVISMLDGLANSFYLQQGDVHSDKTKRLVEEKYLQFNSTINRLFILDKNDIVTINLAASGSEASPGADFSFRNWVKETRNSLKPVFADGFERQGLYRIFISFPIINRETHEYIGIVGTSIPTEAFFAHYGNVEHIESEFLVAYDKGGTMLANGASKSLVGENYFGDYTQTFINHNQILNRLTNNLLAGNSGYAVYNYGRGERLTTEYPVFVNGKPMYFLQLVQPTAQIYSEINDQLFTERIKMFLLLAGTFSAVAVLTVFLIKWNNTLHSQVRTRTNQLDESNKQLESANEQLKIHDKLQKEFINVAAHELRTPIQPILSLTEFVCSKTKDTEQRGLLDVIMKNARRLHRLADDILDVAKIESKSLTLKKEVVNINDLMSRIVQDYTNQIEKTNGRKLKLIYELRQDNIELLVEADRNRLIQVLDNLLNNAAKFTNEGAIFVSLDSKDGHVVVAVSDTGQGIDPEILPQLFSKFATKSELGGTGLGLFICKSIIEAHGGKMWAKNNSINGEVKGATFGFSLPLIKNSEISLRNDKLQSTDMV
jgi:signal transduction histidine kinase